MYSGYKLELNEYNKQTYKFLYNQQLYDIGLELYEDDRSQIEEDLGKFALSQDTLDGDAIMSNWFPKIQADIFISHSHADEKYVISLAGFLYKKFGLKSFIDSCVWGYSVELLKEIDNLFCSTGRPGSYSYEKRNYSTSHVHMMLSISLMKMIDQTECLFFIDTPNSLNTEELIEATNSPWIFAEIALSQSLRRKSKEAHRRRFIKSIRESIESFSNIAYRLNTFHLKEITEDIFEQWCEKYDGTKHGLDVLYNILPPEDNNGRIL